MKPLIISVTLLALAEPLEDMVNVFELVMAICLAALQAPGLLCIAVPIIYMGWLRVASSKQLTWLVLSYLAGPNVLRIKTNRRTNGPIESCPSFFLGIPALHFCPAIEAIVFRPGKVSPLELLGDMVLTGSAFLAATSSIVVSGLLVVSRSIS